MREPVIPGWAEEQTPTPFLYHKLTYFLTTNCRLWGVGAIKIFNMDISIIVSVLGCFVAFLSLGVSMWQNSLHKRAMKTDLLTKYSVRHRVDKDINLVFKYIEQEDGINFNRKVRIPDSHQIIMFLTYFEDLELLIRAKAIDEDIVSYMFYDYLLSFDKIKSRWKDIDYRTDKWKIYHEFYARMKRIRGDKNNNNK